jgi:hypothetical protein
VAYAKLALRFRDDQGMVVTLVALLRREMARRGQTLPVEVRDELERAVTMKLPVGGSVAEGEKRRAGSVGSRACAAGAWWPG